MIDAVTLRLLDRVAENTPFEVVPVGLLDFRQLLRVLLGAVGNFSHRQHDRLVDPQPVHFLDEMSRTKLVAEKSAVPDVSMTVDDRRFLRPSGLR